MGGTDVSNFDGLLAYMDSRITNSLVRGPQGEDPSSEGQREGGGPLRKLEPR